MGESKFGNTLIDNIPASERNALGRDLHDVRFDLRETVYRVGEPIDHVYFPIDCVLSVLTVMKSGESVEIATVGKEGFSASQVILHAEPQSETICQISGSAQCMQTAAFWGHFESSQTFRRDIFAHTAMMFNFMGQSIACNRLHSLNERCARWLLLTHDRVGRSQFFLTQEFLAIMLGTTRPAVTVAAGALQEAGFIRYHRGHLTIENRDGLESAACECYAVNAAAMQALSNGRLPHRNGELH